MSFNRAEAIARVDREWAHAVSAGMPPRYVWRLRWRLERLLREGVRPGRRELTDRERWVNRMRQAGWPYAVIAWKLGTSECAIGSIVWKAVLHGLMPRRDPGRPMLSPREAEEQVILLRTQGLTAREIAAKLNFASGAVVGNIARRLLEQGRITKLSPGRPKRKVA